MTKARRMGLMVLLLSSGISAFYGLLLQRAAHSGIVDFRIVYLAARCMLEHRDPYLEKEIHSVFLEEGGNLPPDPVQRQKFEDAAMAVVYFPTALLIIAPFAAFGWVAAQAMWTVVTIVLLTLACCLTWNVAADSSPPVATCLFAIILANSEVVFAYGNGAGVAISLCAIAVWCLFARRFELVGVVCLAASLAIKPHDSAAVWLYLLIVGDTYRKRALQALLVVSGIGVVAMIWAYHLSPHWIQEMRSNIELVSARGGIADPGPSGISTGTGGMIIELQSLLSVFRDDPHIYNPVTWFICGSLLVVWIRATVRGGRSGERMWLGLAALVPLSMLPVYHRPYDAKLLLLAVPACASLWARGGARRWLALMTTFAAILVTSDIPLTFLTILSRRLPRFPGSISEQILVVVLARPAPLFLLAMSIFYLWVYVRKPCTPTGTIGAGAS